MDVKEMWRERFLDDLQIWNVAFIMCRVRRMTWYNRINSMHVLIIDNNFVCVCVCVCNRDRQGEVDGEIVYLYVNVYRHYLHLNV